MVSDNMDISHRAFNHYLGLKGLTPKVTHENIVVKLGENVPSYSMAYNWATEFKCDMNSLEDVPHPRRPVTFTAQDTIAKTSLWQTYK